MAKAKIILNESLAINHRYRAVLFVASVTKGKKFPTGIKAKYVLIDAEGGFPRLLVDNHEPYGFHMHVKLPEEKEVRVSLSVKDHNEALDLFFGEVERIIAHEKE